MPVLFAATMFVSALLLFLVQPMIGKMTAPLLGGTPAVWNTCMVFFQGLLLAGYYYADRVTRKPKADQIRIHFIVMALPIAAMLLGLLIGDNSSPIPIIERVSPQGSDYPFFGVVAVLSLAIALPFFVVSTSAPLLQKWFSLTGHPSARDPYFLYAASNVGSLLSLLAYPAVVESNLTVAQQNWLWAGGYLLLLGLIVVCGLKVIRVSEPKLTPQTVARMRSSGLNDGENLSHKERKRLRQAGEAGGVAVPPADPNADPHAPSLSLQLRWLGLAFVPSSLMLGVTTFISTDIASLPLMWIIPLALYLLTFIIAFSNLPRWVPIVLTLVAPVLMLLVVFVKVADARVSLKVGFSTTILLHFVMYFFVALLCHTDLARNRPPVRYLTNFYLIMSLGGMLGGIFNGLVAPIVFTFASEYPITVVVACMMLPKLVRTDEDDRPGVLAGLLSFVPGFDSAFDKSKFKDVAVFREKAARSLTSLMIDLGIALSLFGGLLVTLHFFSDVSVGVNDFAQNAFASSPKLAGAILPMLVFGLPCMLAYVFIEKPFRFGLMVAAIYCADYTASLRSERETVQHYGRSFFGTYKVELSPVSYVVRPEQYVENQFHIQNKTDDGVEYRRLQNYVRFVHGTTLHGKQIEHAEYWSATGAFSLFASQNPLGVAAMAGAGGWECWTYPGRDPLTYYHRTGPVGSMFSAFHAKMRAAGEAGGRLNSDVACIGLGTGSLSSYGLPGQNMTFFEIDTHVRRLVEPDVEWVKRHKPDPKENEKLWQPYFFTYIDLARKQGVNIDFVMGDARVTLKRQGEKKYGMMLIDAFSSDAIPAHLLTREAVGLYFDRLEDDGLLAIHISNRYLELEPVVAKIAEALGVEARAFHDSDNSPLGRTASTWICLARNAKSLGAVETGTSLPVYDPYAIDGEHYKTVVNNLWVRLRDKTEDDGRDVALWTDSYSPLMQILRLNFLKDLGLRK